MLKAGKGTVESKFQDLVAFRLRLSTVDLHIRNSRQGLIHVEKLIFLASSHWLSEVIPDSEYMSG
jgi:hypothetical protein